MKLFPTLCLTLFISGCHWGEVKPTIVLPSTEGVGKANGTKASENKPEAVSPATGKPIQKAKQVVQIQESLLTPCSPLPNLLVSNPTGKDVLMQKAKDVAFYLECQKKNADLVRILKEAFNLK